MSYLKEITHSVDISFGLASFIFFILRHFMSLFLCLKHHLKVPRKLIQQLGENNGYIILMIHMPNLKKQDYRWLKKQDLFQGLDYEFFEQIP